MKQNPLHNLMNPRSIATVGAGNNPLKMGTLQALSIIKDGYRGKIYPVHPRDAQVLGFKAYPSVLDLPEPPDLAFFIVPTDQVIPLMEDFGKIGTKYAVVVTAGFKETGPEGQQQEEKLQEVAKCYGIRFLGPNCIGILNSQASLNVTVMTYTEAPGSLGMASQSGTYVTQTFNYLRRKGIRFSKAISVGNEANINIVDALEYLGEDDDTRAIALYIEGIRDGERFIDVARRVTAHKPVVAQYVGGSEAGARAGLSHTGAMAGPDYLYDGIFKQAGIIRVNTVEELYYKSWALATQPPLRGRRLGIITNSGGPGTAIANTANAGGMEMPRFSAKLQAQIREYLPGHASSANPVDLTFHVDAELLTLKFPKLIMQSGEVDAVILHGAMGSGFLREIYPHTKDFLGNASEDEFVQRYERDYTEIMAVTKKYNLPFIVSSFFDQSDTFTAAYQENNIPVIDSPEKAAMAMLALLEYADIRRKKGTRGEISTLLTVNEQAKAVISEVLNQGKQALDEYQAKSVLAAYGIPVTPEELVHTAEKAVEAAKRLGYPLVLKGCSSEIMHKTESGLVHLQIQNETELREAFRKIQMAVPEIPVLVSRMVDGNREFMAGMVRFPGFGPGIMFGLGGIFTEALKDNTIRVAPLSLADAEEMAEDIQSRKLLGSFRGQPPVNLATMGKILQTLGDIALLHPEITEIDLNPIIINGAEPVVVDALCVLA